MTIRSRAAGAVASGTNTVTITATDASGNLATKQYEVTNAGSSKTFTYDANGNLTSDGTRTFEWDARNRLSRVVSGGIDLARYKYDGVGNKVESVEGALVRTYIHADNHVAVERLSTGGSITYALGLGVDSWLGRKNADGSLEYFTFDHLGSVTAHTTPAGVKVLERAYDPFGRMTSGAETNGVSFTGRDWSAEVGLYNYRRRQYDADRGRFASEDPTGLAAGVNLHSYVLNNPLRFSDPSGLTVYECHRPMKVNKTQIPLATHGLLWNAKCKKSYSFGPAFVTPGGPGHIKTDDNPFNSDGQKKDEYS